MLTVNSMGSLLVREVGQEKTPVIVIDDFAVETGKVIDYACRALDYGPDGSSAYPGVRANLPREYVIPVLNSIYKLLFKVYQVPESLGLKPVNTVYSLISTPEKELSLAQRVPHFDSNEPWYLAVLHYLNPGNFCDTGLFRHRPTGFERISEQRLDGFLEASKAYMRAHGEPPKEYIFASSGQYELYHRIEYRPNRLVVYPGNLLHSGLVDPEVDINPDPRYGRLTTNIFINFKEPVSGVSH
jgi:hypothetical protein